MSSYVSSPKNFASNQTTRVQDSFVIMAARRTSKNAKVK